MSLVMVKIHLAGLFHNCQIVTIDVIQRVFVNILLKTSKCRSVRFKTSNYRIWVEKLKIEGSHSNIAAAVQNERPIPVRVEKIFLLDENFDEEGAKGLVIAKINRKSGNIRYAFFGIIALEKKSPKIGRKNLFFLLIG
jgi:hypothetical protein